ncbi:MAG TPA: vWA domain-containing protein [Planctomycetaceae bacterium]|nr:vWA domain-containing protein [Planctomycetaceae bacterium]
MSTSPARTATSTSIRDWVPRWTMFPSWVLSVGVHALLLLALALWLQSQERPPVGFSDEPAREIGIVVKQRGEFVEAPQQEPRESTTGDPSETRPQPKPDQPVKVASELPNLPNVPTETLPSSTPSPLVGAGVASPLAPVSDARDVVKSGGVRTPGEMIASGTPGAAFMGVEDKGTRIVFVIDCSGSMSEHGAMRVAKSALVSSLQALDSAQQFQVVFFNEQAVPLRLKGESKPILYFATNILRTQALQSISAQQPNLGTDRDLAITTGLKLNPDVLFVLTDAGEPLMSAKDLKKIADINRGKARIHTIEFGEGKHLGGPENFLQKLARQNGGTWRYHDVTRFDDAR